MRWPLISRRRHEQAMAVVEADRARLREDRARLREERAQFARDRDTYQSLAAIASRHFTEATAARAAETRRADRLQARLDDALGLTTAAVEAGAEWQQRRHDKTPGATA